MRFCCLLGGSVFYYKLNYLLLGICAPFEKRALFFNYGENVEMTGGHFDVAQ